ncbi:elongation factor P 5-aminopentanone reductase [Bacillus sp. JCM 19034]|uniref:elongation factor P 5-aminopentanone reductase n=1 Tax=Bacillus sp. JCM 19034 TaxID=1481928 RepID=UPI000781772D|nr:SDR family oxidoreductase [Bacillus sp. JCM 19034]
MESILITGASGGIGSEIAKELASPKSSLFLQYFQGEQKIKEIKRICEEKGANVKTIRADLSVSDGAQQLINSLDIVIDGFQTIIHNAGMSQFQLFTETADHDMEALINIHLLNPMKVTRALLPSMIQAKKGNIIMISSIWGQTGAACEVTYSAAKGGMNSFVKALAKEVAPSGIQVNGVAPGAIETTMLKDQGNEHLDQLIEEIPANRLGTPKDISQLVAFLHSNQSNYINGQIISVNGAWYC